MEIRAFNGSDADFEAAAQLENKVWADFPQTAEGIRHNIASRPENNQWRDWIAEQDGQAVGMASHGETFWARKPGKYHVYVAVDPDWRGQGIGTRLFQHCLAGLQQHPGLSQLTAGTREDQPVAIRFLETRGFERTLREPVSKLDLATFDPAPFQAKAERAQAQGLAIDTLRARMDACADWQARYHQLHVAILEDVPRPDVFTPPTLEEFQKRHVEDPHFDPASIWIARRGEAWVGVTELYIPKQQTLNMAYTGLTGVLRSARRLGAATALKLRALQFAQEQGLAAVETDNEENNPMYRLNLALGFKPQPAWLAYRKILDAAPPEA